MVPRAWGRIRVGPDLERSIRETDLVRDLLARVAELENRIDRMERKDQGIG